MYQQQKAVQKLKTRFILEQWQKWLLGSVGVLVLRMQKLKLYFPDTNSSSSSTFYGKSSLWAQEKIIPLEILCQFFLPEVT